MSASNGNNEGPKMIAVPQAVAPAVAPAAAAPVTPPPPEEKRIARYTPPPPDDGQAINAFASESNFNGAQRMATALAASTMVPEAYQGNVPNCLIAIEAASRIRTSVLAVMQNMDIVYGRPCWRSAFLIGLVNSGRRFTPLRFRWQGRMNDVKDMAWGCRAVAADRETGEECVGALITIGLARAEGWFDRKGSKWPNIPEQMLMYRSAGFWSRVFSPESTLGFPPADEVEDYGTPISRLERRLSPDGRATAIDVDPEASSVAQPEPSPTPTEKGRASVDDLAAQARARREATVKPAGPGAEKPGPAQQTLATAAAKPSDDDPDAADRAAAAPRPGEFGAKTPAPPKGMPVVDDPMPQWGGGPGKPRSDDGTGIK